MAVSAIPPWWHICAAGDPEPREGVGIRLEPGVGFGDGTHETTQLCLQAIAALPRRSPWNLLDFGAGSGILAIAAAKLGATVDAVEIDTDALAHADRNARLNAVADRIHLARTLDGLPGPYDVIVANILRPVLLAFAADLVARLRPDGALVLSGLVSTDVPEIVARYSAALDGRRPTVHARHEWRAVVFWPNAA